MSAHTELSSPYGGGDSRQLGFSLSIEPQEALAQRDHILAGVAISLRVLSTSHQVVIGDGARQLCETVTGSVAGPGATQSGSVLPESFQDGDYYFSSSVQDRSAAEMAELVDEIAHRVGDHAAEHPALMARYPDEPQKITALIAEADDEALRWHTWHTFPESGEVVETSSSLRLGPAN